MEEQSEVLKQLQSELERLRRENDALRAKKTNSKVIRTGLDNISVYVEGRKPPVTLTALQWRQIFTERGKEIKAAVEAVEIEKNTRVSPETKPQAG